ncbi:MAG TPA: DUF2203 domain-containing protein [Ignavibacteria bacterium]|nr:DUF2203 domain-containing protein [Ignavibacteria bacterium]
MLHTKHFSLAEARESLVHLKPILKRMTELKKILDERGVKEEKYFFMGTFGKNGSGSYPVEMYEMVGLIQKILSDGVILKRVDIGLIDFPHLRTTGEEVYLCYILGESDIEYWHTISEGFAGRKPIEDL